MKSASQKETNKVIYEHYNTMAISGVGANIYKLLSLTHTLFRQDLH